MDNQSPAPALSDLVAVVGEQIKSNPAGYEDLIKKKEELLKAKCLDIQEELQNVDGIDILSSTGVGTESLSKHDESLLTTIVSETGESDTNSDVQSDVSGRRNGLSPDKKEQSDIPGYMQPTVSSRAKMRGGAESMGILMRFLGAVTNPRDRAKSIRSGCIKACSDRIKNLIESAQRRSPDEDWLTTFERDAEIVRQSRMLVIYKNCNIAAYAAVETAAMLSTAALDYLKVKSLGMMLSGDAPAVVGTSVLKSAAQSYLDDGAAEWENVPEVGEYSFETGNPFSVNVRTKVLQGVVQADGSIESENDIPRTVSFLTSVAIDLPTYDNYLKEHPELSASSHANVAAILEGLGIGFDPESTMKPCADDKGSLCADVAIDRPLDQQEVMTVTWQKNDKGGYDPTGIEYLLIDMPEFPEIATSIVLDSPSDPLVMKLALERNIEPSDDFRLYTIAVPMQNIPRYIDKATSLHAGEWLDLPTDRPASFIGIDEAMIGMGFTTVDKDHPVNIKADVAGGEYGTFTVMVSKLGQVLTADGSKSPTTVAAAGFGLESIGVMSATSEIYKIISNIQSKNDDLYDKIIVHLDDPGNKLAADVFDILTSGGQGDDNNVNLYDKLNRIPYFQRFNLTPKDKDDEFQVWYNDFKGLLAEAEKTINQTMQDLEKTRDDALQKVEESMSIVNLFSSKLVSERSNFDFMIQMLEKISNNILKEYNSGVQQFYNDNGITRANGDYDGYHHSTLSGVDGDVERMCERLFEQDSTVRSDHRVLMYALYHNKVKYENLLELFEGNKLARLQKLKEAIGSVEGLKVNVIESRVVDQVVAKDDVYGLNKNDRISILAIDKFGNLPIGNILVTDVEYDSADMVPTKLEETEDPNKVTATFYNIHPGIANSDLDVYTRIIREDKIEGFKAGTRIGEETNAAMLSEFQKVEFTQKVSFENPIEDYKGEKFVVQTLVVDKQGKIRFNNIQQADIFDHTFTFGTMPKVDVLPRSESGLASSGSSFFPDAPDPVHQNDGQAYLSDNVLNLKLTNATPDTVTIYTVKKDLLTVRDMDSGPIPFAQMDSYIPEMKIGPKDEIVSISDTYTYTDIASMYGNTTSLYGHTLPVAEIPGYHPNVIDQIRQSLETAENNDKIELLKKLTGQRIGLTNGEGAIVRPEATSEIKETLLTSLDSGSLVMADKGSSDLNKLLYEFFESMYKTKSVYDPNGSDATVLDYFGRVTRERELVSLIPDDDARKKIENKIGDLGKKTGFEFDTGFGDFFEDKFIKPLNRQLAEMKMLPYIGLEQGSLEENITNREGYTKTDEGLEFAERLKTVLYDENVVLSESDTKLKELAEAFREHDRNHQQINDFAYNSALRLLCILKPNLNVCTADHDRVSTDADSTKLISAVNAITDNELKGSELISQKLKEWINETEEGGKKFEKVADAWKMLSDKTRDVEKQINGINLEISEARRSGVMNTHEFEAALEEYKKEMSEEGRSATDNYIEFLNMKKDILDEYPDDRIREELEEYLIRNALQYKITMSENEGKISDVLEKYVKRTTWKGSDETFLKENDEAFLLVFDGVRMIRVTEIDAIRIRAADPQT